MSKSLYIHTPYNIPFLEELFQVHQKQFEEWLNDSFTDEELDFFQEKIDTIAHVLIDLKVDSIGFEDYESISGDRELKNDLFNRLNTTISLNDMPFLESNPFQVSYLFLLVNKLENILIDPGSLNDLLSKDEYLKKLDTFKKAEDLLINFSPTVQAPKKTHSRVFDPIDYLITEIYNELKRLEVAGKLPIIATDLPEKAQKLLAVMQTDYFNASDLLRLTSLHPKDFDDHLEKLKFYLRKVDS